MTLDYKISDLTVNLTTLEFKSILTKENINYLPLRSRSHCLFVNACLHSYFYVNVFNVFRKACYRIKTNGSNTHFTKFMLEMNDSDDIATKVGVIGYGRLGATLCKDLTESLCILPSNLYIQTRNKESTNKIKGKGINIDENYSTMIENCSIIFVCVLASQIEDVGNKIRGKLRFDQVLYVFTTGVHLKRLKRVFMHEGIITESYLWNDDLHETWDFSLSVDDVLEDDEISATTCPLPIYVTKALYINCLPKLFTNWIYSLCNVGTALKISSDVIVRLLNFALLETDKPKHIIMNDIVQGVLNEEEILPDFSICSITQNLTFLDQKLSMDEDFQVDLLNNYLSVSKSFNKYKKFAVDK